MLLALLQIACFLLPNKDEPTESTPLDSEPVNTEVCTEPVEPTCVDEIILDLSLHDDKVSDGAVENTTDGDDFVTTVDASAGGSQQAANNPWVYLRFGPEGAERVDIDDETALTSMDWDLAAKRFVLRLNGGDSGASCVGGAAFTSHTYAELTEVPEGLEYSLDDFYTDDCSFVNDTSGLQQSPQVVLSPWWSYPGCVATTGTPFLIQRADGSVVKLVVEAYYGTGQEACNATGTPGSDSAHYTFRWTWMD